MRRSRFTTSTGEIDYILLIITVILVVIGTIMIATASMIVANYLLGGSDDYFFFKKQILWASVGIIALLVATKIPYTFWRDNAPMMLVIGILFLASVFIPGLSKEVKGASRWIHIGPFTAQPSEFIKLFLSCYLAAWLSKKGADVQDLKYGLLPFGILMGVILLLLQRQSDLGTTLVILAIALVVFFVSGAHTVQIAISVGTVGVLVLLLIFSTPYRVERFTTFLDPFANPQGSGYHINQSLLALGNGGLFGVGFGHSRQKYRYLPEPHTDSIFAIIGEEFGAFGTSILIGLYALFGIRAFSIAKRAPDSFSRLLATAIAFWIPAQAVINVAAMVSLVPLTGIPLPFISYGGSSLIVTLIAVGILLNISRYAQRQSNNANSYHPDRRRNARTY